MVVAKDKIILSGHIGALCFATLKGIRPRKPEAANNPCIYLQHILGIEVFLRVGGARFSPMAPLGCFRGFQSSFGMGKRLRLVPHKHLSLLRCMI